MANEQAKRNAAAWRARRLTQDLCLHAQDTTVPREVRLACARLACLIDVTEREQNLPIIEETRRLLAMSAD